MGRVDFLRETATAKLYVNEINTMPGFTSISMYPKMWAYCGIPYGELIDRLIQLALERRAAGRPHDSRDNGGTMMRLFTGTTTARAAACR